MFEFWQGGNLYTQSFSGISGTVTSPLPGGGTISIGGSSTDIGGGGNPYPPIYAGGPYPAGQFPPGTMPGTVPMQQNGLASLFQDPMMLILIVILIVWLSRD